MSRMIDSHDEPKVEHRRRHVLFCKSVRERVGGAVWPSRIGSLQNYPEYHPYSVSSANLVGSFVELAVILLTIEVTCCVTRYASWLTSSRPTTMPILPAMKPHST